MATITTKYSVGAVVYYATTTIAQKQHPCPDCLGSRLWRAISPAGGEYTFACPRCSTQFNADRDLLLNYSEAVPFAKKMTIGSIQFNTAHGCWDSGARYMCYETGIGSGSVYEEARLFTTEAEALVAAQALAAATNQEAGWIVKLYDKSLRVSDYELDSAMVQNAARAKSQAEELLYNLDDLFAKIEEANDKNDILDAVAEYRETDWTRDKERAASTDDGELI